ncbi:GNAT family N-acetyltransferase [Bacteroidota bacterium]
MTYLTERLNSSHNRKGFNCGKITLDNYLHHQANQDIKRKLSICFVLNDKKTNLIQAYYTLANNSIHKDQIIEKIKNKLPKSYSSIPTTLLGRLAVDRKFQGQGIGKIMLIDALKRSFDLSKNIGSFAVVVDPLDNEAEDFYGKFGFIKLPDSGKMFLAMKTIKQLFEK